MLGITRHQNDGKIGGIVSEACFKLGFYPYPFPLLTMWGLPQFVKF
jgi:hypothetical protein